MTPRPIRVHTERRIFRSTCQTSLVRAAERTSRMAPMFDGHARLRAVERGLVCACPLGERLFTCSRARIPVTWRKHPYTRHRSRAVAARRRPTRPRSRDRRRPAPSRPQLREAVVRLARLAAWKVRPSKRPAPWRARTRRLSLASRGGTGSVAVPEWVACMASTSQTPGDSLGSIRPTETSGSDWP